MKKNIFLIIVSIIFVVTGLSFAFMPKVTLECDGQNCVMYRNYFGQIIKAKYQFTYNDVTKCEVQPVKTIDKKENGQIAIKTFTLRLMGDNIKYTPEWVKKDAEKLSSICLDFAKQKPLAYSDGGILDLLKNLWALFVIAGLGLLAIASRK